MKAAAHTEIDGLSVATWKGGTWLPLVAEVSLPLSASDVVALVGETGAGKTLAMKAVAGLLPRGVRASGRLLVAGKDPVDLSKRDARRRRLGRDVGFVLQNPMGAFDPLVRVGPQLTEGVLVHKMMRPSAARKRAIRLLDALGIRDPEEVVTLYPHQLSGGMSQRAAIAMAMMPSPPLLIADEPTSALDANVRIDVLRVLREVAAEEGSAVVVVTHDLSLVSRLCDWIAVMYAGRIVESGLTRDVLAAPQHPYTSALSACVPTLATPPRTRLPAIEGSPPAPGAWPPACSFEPRCPAAVGVCARERPNLLSCGDRRAACHFAFEWSQRAPGP